MTTEADIHLIQRIIPHRYPFLLIDKVRDIVPNTSAVGIKNVTFNEPHFQGHDRRHHHRGDGTDRRGSGGCLERVGRHRFPCLFHGDRQRQVPPQGHTGRCSGTARGRDARQAGRQGLEVQGRGDRRGRNRLRGGADSDVGRAEVTIDPSAKIHPSAVIEDGAVIGPGVTVGAFSMIGPGVVLAQDVQIHSHVVLSGETQIGEGTVIFSFASIGGVPQDLKFGGEKTRLIVGARNRIREHVTMNTGTAQGGGETVVGDDGLFMAGCHIAHDCRVGNRVVVVNQTAIAGHCQIEDDVIIGGLSGIHQWVRIGRGAIIGALSMVTNDVVPYGLVTGPRAELDGLNLVGLKRKGVARADIQALRIALLTLKQGEGTFLERARRLGEETESDYVRRMVEFITGASDRSFLVPK